MLRILLLAVALNACVPSQDGPGDLSAEEESAIVESQLFCPSNIPCVWFNGDGDFWCSRVVCKAVAECQPIASDGTGVCINGFLP
jgi:hypothetical protein